MKQAFGLILALVVISTIFVKEIKAQDTVNTTTSCLKTEILTNFNNFDGVHVGYYGTTQNCLAYNVYAFKYRRTWFLIANQSQNLTYLVARPPRTEGQQVVGGSEYLVNGLSKAYANSYWKFKKRRKVVKDIKIYGYYKFFKPGRKAIKGLLLLEYPKLDVGPSWPFKWVVERAQAVQADAESIIPEITEDAATAVEAVEQNLQEAVPEIKIEAPEIPVPK